MRIGLIGCGWIAETHLESLRALGESVACVCDPGPGAPAWAAEATGARGVRRLGVAARPAASPTPCSCSRRRALHREVTVAALERGLPVYLEKPVARDLADAQAIVAAAERTGVVCAIGYQWRAIDWLADVARRCSPSGRSGCWSRA